MGSMQVLLITVFELTSTMILWNALNPGAAHVRVKSMGIVGIVSAITLFTNTRSEYFGIIINYTALILCVKQLLDKSLWDAVYEFCIVGPLNMVIQLFITFPLQLIFNRIGIGSEIDLGIVITLLTMFVSIGIYRWGHLRQWVDSIDVQIRRTYILLLDFLCYVLISKMLWVRDRQLILDNIVLLILIPIVLVTTNLLYLRYTAQKLEQRKTRELHEQYSPMLLHLIEEVRQRQHDFKNHLNMIYGISEVSSLDSLREDIQHYIAALAGSLRSVENLVFINNKTLAAILYGKISEAKRNEIRLLYNMRLEREDFELHDYELTEIITNLLDNAFEAVAQNDEAHREVNIAIANLEEALSIEVKNEGLPIESQLIAKLFNSGFSTKAAQGRGYGLHRIKKIVEFHGGEIQLSSDNGYNSFRVYFCRHSGISGSPQK